MKTHRFIVAAVLALASLTAFAQECAPAPVGAGTHSKQGRATVGEWYVHFCPTPYTWVANYLLKRDDYKLVWPEPAVAAHGLPELYEQVKGMNTMSKITDPILQPLYEPAREWAMANKPADPIWQVKANGTTTTRPTYWITTDGKRGALTTLRAPVGLHCQCAPDRTRVIDATGTWCPYVTGQTRVDITLCAPAAPVQ